MLELPVTGGTQTAHNMDALCRSNDMFVFVFSPADTELFMDASV